MNPLYQNLAIVVIMLIFGLMEWTTGRYRSTVRATGNDTKLELFMFLSLVAIAQPVTILAATKLCAWLLPNQQGVLAQQPWWILVGVLLICDDMTQYWWHRISHSPLLWPLHRAHHTATYMSIRMTYRNNFFYYLLMPGLWFAGVAIYLGFGTIYAFYISFKFLVVLSAHSAWSWDEPLYRIRGLRPIMWVVQRTISTPSTHWAHHSITNADGIGNYKGNFGNLLFFWDVLFGTAHITQQYPKGIGLQSDKVFGQEHWSHQMFFPVLRSSRPHTALQIGGREYAETETVADSAVARPTN
jgi:sterol desaturase/sphingolipid hydroxylase (fatty acid hydroxylase superfamily)